MLRSTRLPRVNVQKEYASALQSIARLASEILLSNLRELINRERLDFVMIAPNQLSTRRNLK
jgi:hypothetical protein